MTAQTDAERHAILRRYVDYEITAGEAADALGPGTAIVDVILAARQAFGRLPDRRDAFTENEFRRALVLLGLEGDPPAPASPPGQ